jgi:glycosyltransferase involved in cell wall biosynthesis
VTALPDKPPDLSVVIACYQEEEHLVESVHTLRKTLDGLGRSYELVFVEDKSRDRTAQLIRELIADRPNERAVFHEHNQGRGATVTEGFRLAKGRIVGFLDIDLEVHCKFLPGVLAAIDAGADGATAYREYTVEARFTSLLRAVLSDGYRRLFQWSFDVPFRDPETGFKFFVRDRILPVLDKTRDPGWFWDSEIMVLAHMAGLRVVEVPARFQRRADKTSTVRIWRDIWRYLLAIRAFKKRLRAARTVAQAPAG